MDEGFVAAIESDAGTRLDRLGSGKLLIALTGADLSREAVLGVAADREHAATATFEAWADDEPDDRAREAFAGLAGDHAERYDRVVDRLDGHDPGAPGAVHDRLRELDGTAARAGGAVAVALLDARAHTQFVSFFINEASSATTDAFRSFREESEAAAEEGAALVETVCTGSGRETAREAATGAIEAAYAEYADALGALGMDPKPIC